MGRGRERGEREPNTAEESSNLGEKESGYTCLYAGCVKTHLTCSWRQNCLAQERLNQWRVTERGTDLSEIDID